MKSTGRQRRHGTAIAWLVTGVMSVAIMSTGNAARAADGAYVDVSLGVGLPSDVKDSDGFTSDFSPGISFSGAVGYKWRWMRFEGEISYASFGIRDQVDAAGVERPTPPAPCFFCSVSDLQASVSALTFMANAYVDIDLSDKTRLYFGGGIGRSQVNADYHYDVSFIGLPTEEVIKFVDDGDNVLAYQGRVGLVFDYMEGQEIFLGYRYFATGDPTFNVVEGGTLSQDGLVAHIVEFGYRYHF